MEDGRLPFFEFHFDTTNTTKLSPPGLVDWFSQGDSAVRNQPIQDLARTELEQVVGEPQQTSFSFNGCRACGMWHNRPAGIQLRTVDLRDAEPMLLLF